jgi:hypothetical protein
MSKSENTPNPLLPFLEELQLVRLNPRSQVIITSGNLELLVNTLMETKCKHGKKMSGKRDYGIKLMYLNEVGVISDDEFTYLDAFRDLRNEAAHARQFNLTAEMLTPFKGLLERNKLEKFYNVESFQNICHACFGGFWNNHLDVFFDYFEKLEPMPRSPQTI